MARITLSGIFLVALFGAWAHAQRQDLNDPSFPQRNTNNVRLVNKDFNAYREAESIFSPLGLSSSSAVPSESEQGLSGGGLREGNRNEDRITTAEYNQDPYRPAAPPVRPYWEERTYEFQYGEPKIYREQPYNNRIDNFPLPVKDDVVLSSDLDIFGTGWSKFQEKENKVQQQQQFQNAPAVQLDILASEPCTVTEVLTTTYFVKPRPIVTEFTYSTVLVECPPTPTPTPQPLPQPQPYYIEPYPYYAPCEVCEYPHNCDHCPRPRVTRPPVYTAPIHKLPCDKCHHPDNCDHCPHPHPHPHPHPPQPQPYPAPCELCQHPQNCDHCFRAHGQAYQAPCELCAHPQNCDHCPHPPHRGPDPIPCDVCRQPDVCDHCHGPVHDERVHGAGGREREERRFSGPSVEPQQLQPQRQGPAPRVVAVVQPKRHPQAGPQVIEGNGEEQVDASEQEEQELLW